MATYMSPFYSWSASSASSSSVHTPNSSGTINMKVEEWLSESASLASPLVDEPESQARRREECADPQHDKIGDKNKANRDSTARDDLLSDIDIKANQGRALPKPRCLTISSPRPIQGLRDSFTGMSRMTKEDREECREMAREWSYHDPEIRERVEKMLEEQECRDPREKQEEEEEEAIDGGSWEQDALPKGEAWS